MFETIETNSVKIRLRTLIKKQEEYQINSITSEIFVSLMFYISKAN